MVLPLATSLSPLLLLSFFFFRSCSVVSKLAYLHVPLCFKFFLSFSSLFYLSLLQQDTTFLLFSAPNPLSLFISPLFVISLSLSLSFPVSPLCKGVRAPGVSGKIGSVGGTTQSRPDWGRPSNHCENETGKLLTDFTLRGVFQHLLFWKDL